MNNEWDDYADDWDRDPTVQEYANKAFAVLSKAIELDGLSVLDFGCGTGALSQLLGPKVKDIVALDGSSKMIQLLAQKQLNNVSTIAGFLSAELIGQHPCLNEKFDLIVASSVCSFLPDYEATLTQLKSLLKTGGLFMQFDWLANDDVGMGLSERRVQSALTDNGFSDINITQPFVMTSSKGTMTVLMASGKNA